jgi:hypothetical protein
VQHEPSRLLDDYLEPLTSGATLPGDDLAGVVGRTMFDSGQSEDGSVTVLLPKDEIARVPTQALVRIRSEQDGRSYLGWWSPARSPSRTGCAPTPT